MTSETRRRVRLPSPDEPSVGLILILGLLSGLSPFAMDMYLAAFPGIARDLDASASGVQLTLTLFVFAMAVGTLVFGPLSDRYGRRIPLLIGMGVATLSGCAAAAAPTIETLIVLRIVQGFGVAAGPVIARAVAADIWRGARGARIFGVMMLVLAVAPVVAPIAGAPLVELGGWRLTLLAVAAILLAATFAAVAGVPESLPRENRTEGGSFWSLIRSMLTLLRDRRFLMLTLITGFAFGAIMAWIAASPFLLQEYFGLEPVAFAWAFSVNSLGFMAGGFANAWLLRRCSPASLLRAGVYIALAAAVTLGLAVALGNRSLPMLLACVSLMSAAGALSLSNAAAIAVLSVPQQRAGAASAVIGAVESMLPAIWTPVLGLLGSHPEPLVVALLVNAALAALALLFAGEPGGRRARARVRAI